MAFKKRVDVKEIDKPNVQGAIWFHRPVLMTIYSLSISMAAQSRLSVLVEHSRRFTRIHNSPVLDLVDM